MKVRLFLLISITFLALGLVSLALVGASAQSIDKPTGSDLFTPAVYSANQLLFHNSTPGMDLSIPTVNTSHGPNPIDQMRQEVMTAPHSPDDLDRVEFWLNQSSMSSMWGHVDPGATLTITTPREKFYAYADPMSGEWATGAHELYPGDEVTVSASSGYSVTITIPDPLEAHADSSLGEIWGEIGGWYNQDVEVHRWWVDESVDPPLVVQTDGSGAFVAADENMPRGSVGYIRFADQVSASEIIYHHPYYDIVPGLRVNYGHDWAEGTYEPGYSVWLTLTNSTGDIKDTAAGETGLIPGWDGGTGFSTHYNVLWSSGKTPDIEAGDWVYLSIENGYSNQMRLGTIEGALDYAADTISGNIYAPWITQTLNGGCSVWTDGGPEMVFQASPNGGSYFCDFGDIGWDLMAGQEVAVNYYEPDNDLLYNVFRDPAPHLWISTEGASGEPGEGGNYTLIVAYNNDGDAIAEDMVITATFLNGMSYLGDTSGVLPVGTGQPGDPLVWQMNDLLPDDGFSNPLHFYVFAQIEAFSGEQIEYEVRIGTSTEYWQDDPWNKYSDWNGWVLDNNTDVEVGKSAWTWDPLPGSEFVYSVNVCGIRNTGSSELALTDTLPLSTTLVGWWAQHPGWEEVSKSDHQLVLSRPSVSGEWCGDVYISALLDDHAWQGMELVNTAEIYADNDLDHSNDSSTVVHPVGEPHTNLSVWKDWNWGSYVPGGKINYEYRYQNTGNLPVENVLVTQTLPAGTSLLFAYTWDDWGWVEITPETVTPDYLVWDAGFLESGHWKDMGVALRISPATEPGSLLTHTIEISPQPFEDRYDDNRVTSVERVNEHGPNLSLDKHSNWFWTWEGQLQYELRIRNLGDEPLDNVWITDTYPISTTFNDSWWQNHGPWITYTHVAQNRQIVMWVDYLNPGGTASVGYQLDLESKIIGVEGLEFTNVVEGQVANDTNLLDNLDAVTAYTGPDVFVRKWISDGEPHPGELVTFTVEFGNQNLWPWDGDLNYPSHITDTQPAGMTFVRAVPYWDPGGSFDPEILPGNQLVWEWGTMWSDSTWTFDLVVQIGEESLGGEVTNHIEAYGDSLEDIEPNWDNNVFDLVMVIEAAPQSAYVSNSPVKLGEMMVFTNTSYAGYPATTTYAWEFGDGETSTDENPTHTYAAPGTYTVTLTANNEIGSSTYSQEVEVLPPLMHLPLVFKND